MREPTGNQGNGPWSRPPRFDPEDEIRKVQSRLKQLLPGGGGVRGFLILALVVVEGQTRNILPLLDLTGQSGARP